MEQAARLCRAQDDVAAAVAVRFGPLESLAQLAHPPARRRVEQLLRQLWVQDRVLHVDRLRASAIRDERVVRCRVAERRRRATRAVQGLKVGRGSALVAI